MNDTQKIRSVVARYFGLPETEITDTFVFPPGRLQSSAGRFTFHAAIKRMAGTDLPTAWKARTFGELLNEIPEKTPAGVSAAPAKPASAPAMSETSSVGIDIENLEDHPWSGGAMTEPFFLENFTPAERAYCSRQIQPGHSLCGLWCAKEAAIKSGGSFAGLKPSQIEIIHDEQGRPALCAAGSPASGVSLSISHAKQSVVAVCVPLPQVQARMATIQSAPDRRRWFTWAGFLLACIGLGLTIWDILKAKH